MDKAETMERIERALKRVERAVAELKALEERMRRFQADALYPGS